MKRGIAESIAKYGISNDEFSLSLKQMRGEIDKITVDGKQQWILNMMHKDNSMSLVIVNFKGNKGKVSRVSLNPLYEKQIMNEILNLNVELNSKRLEELKQQANINTPVDPDSLQSFIEKTAQTYAEKENDPNAEPAYIEALARNLLIAGQLKDNIVANDDGTFHLPECWFATDSGRIYGKGLSLQRVPKEVRNAALGRCHQYDFKASSFALMTGLALQLDPELKVADLVDYIKNRDSIRKRLAGDLGISEKRVKAIFTSLGFGASTANNPFTSIRGTLSSETYAKLMADAQFKHICAGLKLVRSTILEHFASDDFEFCGLKYNCIDPNSEDAMPKKRSKNQKLAWIYQAMESQATTLFGQMANDAGYDVLLAAHDCLYFKDKLPVELLNNILWELTKTYSLLAVEHEEKKPISLNLNTSKAEAKAKSVARWVEKEQQKQVVADVEEDRYWADLIHELNGPAKIGLGTTFNASRYC